MQLGTRFALALLLTTIQFSATSAEDAPKAKVFEELIPFSSDEGLARLARSTAKVDFPVLANQFEAQSNPALGQWGCTAASLTPAVLRTRNALSSKVARTPFANQTRGRLDPAASGAQAARPRPRRSADGRLVPTT